MTLTQEKRFVVLTSLYDLGGRATKKAVLDNILDKGYLNLTSSDFAMMDNRSEQAWRNGLAFIRKHLVDEGRIDGSVKDSWALTANGEAYHRELAAVLSNAPQIYKLTYTGVTKAEAITRTGIRVEPLTSVLAEEVSNAEALYEGATRTIQINAYERNDVARQRCIAHYGPQCRACGFDFGRVYGAAGAGFIHVHHLRPLAQIGIEYAVDPIADLRPVCPNCHAMIHLRQPPYAIEEIQTLLAGNK